MRIQAKTGMKQIHKFYLTEFLKTQRYFIPIMILFLQFYKLSFTEIFLLYAVQSFVVFMMEIPSGVVADQFGKKTALIFSRLSLIPAYAIFAVADDFWMFLLAMIFIAFNKAFKSGTHKAYIYDYLDQNETNISPSEVFGKNKFWARIGEASASAAGGIIAVKIGFSAVFIFALFPAVSNSINALTYEHIEEEHKLKTFSFRTHFSHIGESLAIIKNTRVVWRLIINSAVFVFCMEAAEKFFQPYMVEAQIPIAWFGFVYMGIMILAAFGTRYAFSMEKKISRATIANASAWIGIIPLLIVGFRFISITGIFLFFIMLFLKSARRPGMITELNSHIPSKKRATILSTDSLFRSLFALALLPVVGYISDAFSIYTAMLAIGIFLAASQFLFPIPQPKRQHRDK